MPSPVLEYVNILDLPAHPDVTVEGELLAIARGQINFGVDNSADGNSYRVSLAQMHDWLNVSSSVSSVAQTLSAPSHGFGSLLADGMPRPVYVASNGTVTLANSAALGTAPVAYLVGAPDANSLTLQQTGLITVEGGHGLTVGQRYYLQSSGSIASTPGSILTIVVYFAVSDTELLLMYPSVTPTPLVLVDFVVDIESPNFYYYGFGYAGNSWKILRYSKVTVQRSQANTGYASLTAAWPNRTTASYS